MRVLIRLMILVLVPLSSNLRSQDTKLGYEYIKLHGEKKGLAQHNYEPVMIDMEYPYFTGDSTSYEFLNSEISNYLFESHKTFDKLCGSFFRDHRRDSSDDRTSNWSVIKTIDVVYLSSNLVSLTSFYEKQEGLNIFFEQLATLNYEMDDKKRLTLEDVFDENYKKYLLTLIWFRLHQLKDGNNNLMKFYTETLDNVLTQQFYITEKEFVMIFAKGEIAHRIYGDLVVGVPYSEIKPIMKMNLVE